MEIDELHEGVSLGSSRDANRQGGQLQVGEPMTEQAPAAAEQRSTAATRLESLAMAGHHAAGDLKEQFPLAARYMRDVAYGFEHVSNLLRDPNLDEVAALVGNLGRRQPSAIVAWAVLIGLGLSWFVKGSDVAPERTPSMAGEGGSYGVH
jgi:hypothetical protein